MFAARSIVKLASPGLRQIVPSRHAHEYFNMVSSPPKEKISTVETAIITAVLGISILGPGLFLTSRYKANRESK